MKKTIQDFQMMKENREPVAAVVVYENWMARQAEKADVDWILIGDSVNMALYGEKSTAINPPTMDCMLKHTDAVRRGAPNTFIVGDMPEGSYGSKVFIPDNGWLNAKSFIEKAKVDAIKLEGGVKMSKRVEWTVKSGIPVMGHIGLTPQTIPMDKWGTVYGETANEALALLNDALALEEAGVFAILLEKVAEETATEIAKKLKIPIFSIGAGRYCDGQLLLSCDILGTFDLFNIKFVKCYATEKNYSRFLEEIKIENFKRQDMDKDKILPTMSRFTEFCFKMYVKDVKNGKFPEEKHIYRMKEGEYEKLMNLSID